MALTLISMNAWDSFVKLFAEMDALVIVLFVLGIICSAIEIFSPGFGVFGIAGIALIIAGIVVRMVNGGDAWMLLFMILISIVLFVLCFVLLSKSVRKGRLGKTSLFNIGTAVQEGKTDGTRDYTYLIGRRGKTVTFLRPVGRAEFGGEIVDVVAYSGFIDEDCEVVVTEVEGQRVSVRKI